MIDKNLLEPAQISFIVAVFTRFSLGSDLNNSIACTGSGSNPIQKSKFIFKVRLGNKT